MTEEAFDGSVDEMHIHGHAPSAIAGSARTTASRDAGAARDLLSSPFELAPPHHEEQHGSQDPPSPHGHEEGAVLPRRRGRQPQPARRPLHRVDRDLHPTEEPSRVEIDTDKARDWLAKGAQPTEAVVNILAIAGITGPADARKAAKARRAVVAKAKPEAKAEVKAKAETSS